MDVPAHSPDLDLASRRTQLSLKFFLGAVCSLGVGFLALLHSISNWKSSSWGFGEPGSAIWITAAAVFVAFPCIFISIGFGLFAIRGKPVVLLWILPQIAGLALLLLLILLNLR